MKPPLTKQQFCTAIDNIKDYWDKQREIEDVLGVVFSEGAIVDIIDNYVDTLSLIMRDFPAVGSPVEDIPWIAYFCWELDFGKKYKKDYVKIDDVEFPLETPDDLYELLIELYWTEEN